MTPEPGEPELVEQSGVGEPDAFARLWTPHRLAYIRAGTDPVADAGDTPVPATAPASAGSGVTAELSEPSCPFCRIPTLGDAEGLIIARGSTVYAVLNLYPYNPGHLMVVPYRHIPDYTDLEPAELAEFSSFTRRAMGAARAASAPHGFNIGINSGTAAGAGIAAHLHQHVVPRWGGDANFMPVIAQTKVLPELLAETRQRLADAWPDAD